MRIMIVDDEALERKGLSKMILQEMPEISIVGEARNGRAAIELADQLSPDVMMMDIKMPGIDGVEAVRTIRKKHKDIKFIMVSAFNTFEYAKEVMQQGVKEYILKPSRKDEVIAALRRVQLEIQEEQEQQQEQVMLKENYIRALTLMETEWLSSLLLEQVEEMYIEEWNQLLSIKAESGFIVLFTFRTEKDPLVKETKKNYYTWLKQNLKDRYNDIVVGPMIDDKIPVLVLVKKSTKNNQIKSFAKVLCRSMILKFKEQFFNDNLVAGIGLPYETIEDFPKSYHEALVALEHVYDSDLTYGFVSEQGESISKKKHAFEKESQLLEQIKLGDRSKAMHLFDQYFGELNEAANGAMDKLVQLIEEFFIVISRDLYKMGYPSSRKLTYKNISSADELHNNAKLQIGEIIQHVSVWRKTHIKGIIEQAKEYIDQKFKEAITLEEVAESVNLTPFYFSKIFKERLGVTFIDYLTDLRINFAKEEMKSSDKSLKEICFNVGYKDPNYFSRVFKKKTGDTPTDFRNKYFK